MSGEIKQTGFRLRHRETLELPDRTITNNGPGDVYFDAQGMMAKSDGEADIQIIQHTCPEPKRADLTPTRQELYDTFNKAFKDDPSKQKEESMGYRSSSKHKCKCGRAMEIWRHPDAYYLTCEPCDIDIKQCDVDESGFDEVYAEAHLERADILKARIQKMQCTLADKILELENVISRACRIESDLGKIREAIGSLKFDEILGEKTKHQGD